MQGSLFEYSYGFNPNQHPTGLIVPDYVTILPNKKCQLDMFWFIH